MPCGLKPGAAGRCGEEHPAGPQDPRHRWRRLPSRPQLIRLGAALALCASSSVAFVAWPDGRGAAADTPQWIRHPEGAFSISATEVTVAQFHACTEAGACDAATTDPACNYGTPGRETHPVNCVTYEGAEQYCTSLGARLCTEEEWLAACRGPDGHAFPYGDVFDLGACNSQSATRRVEGRELSTAPVASHAGCQGGLPGLFDMAGNVAEWVDACKDTYCKFRGAGYLSNEPLDSFAACSAICSGNDKNLRSGVVGIRCCKDESG